MEFVLPLVVREVYDPTTVGIGVSWWFIEIGYVLFFWEKYLARGGQAKPFATFSKLSNTISIAFCHPKKLAVHLR